MSTRSVVSAWQAQCLLDSPLGPMRLVASAQGVAGLWFEGQRHHPGELALPHQPEHPWLAQAAQELAQYWARPRTATFTVPLDAQGTPFQHAVWAALRELPPGHTTDYATLAQRVGRPGAARAVGSSVGRNPISLIVPCHRVLGRDGSLTGYAGGLARKHALLAAEGVATQEPA